MHLTVVPLEAPDKTPSHSTEVLGSQCVIWEASQIHSLLVVRFLPLRDDTHKYPLQEK